MTIMYDNSGTESWALRVASTILLLITSHATATDSSPAEIPTTEWFVNPSNGSDDPSNPGTDPTSPLGSIQRCADLMVTHSLTPPSPSTYQNGIRGRCLLAGGEYAPSPHTGRGVVIEGLRGTPTAVYEVAPRKDGSGNVESVRFVGYDEVSGGGWTYEAAAAPGEDGPSVGHWRTTVDPSLLQSHPHGGWQLFVDGEMYLPARWPDAAWDDGGVFAAEGWASSTAESVFSEDEDADSTVVEASGELAASGMNVTGASAVLNVKHWFTFSTAVTQHTPGNSTVVYRKQPGWKGDKWIAGKDIFFLENKPEFISRDTEWHLDARTGELLVALRGGPDADPSSLTVGLRVQEYAFRITDSTDLRIRDMSFLGTTLYAASFSSSTTVNGIHFDSLQLVHPSAMKRATVGDHRHSWPTTLYEKFLDQPCRNRIFNCTLVGNEGHPTTHLRGAGITLDNNLFHKVDYTAVTTVPCRPVWTNGASLLDDDPALCDPSPNYVGGGTAVDVSHGTASQPALVRRNTIDVYGGSSGLTVGKNVDVLFNRISGGKDIQLDGAMVQGGAHDRYETGDLSDRWEPNLCSDLTTQSTCSDAMCTWTSSSSSCSGNPSEEYLARPENQPPADATDGSSYHGTNYSFNWLYDATNPRISKRALRFDRPQATCNGRFGNTWANHGSMLYNVAWNTNGIMVKGSGIISQHNTAFQTESNPDLTVYDEFNEGTCNCADAYCVDQPTTCCVTLADGTDDDATFEGRTNTQTNNLLGGVYQNTEGPIDHLLPGNSTGNVAGPDALLQLRDIANLDFRPRAIDSNTTLGGAAPAGAYGANDDVYWIPGRRDWIASSPIPPDGAQLVQLDADLMFLPRLPPSGGDGSSSSDDDDTHLVYAACSPDRLLGGGDSVYQYILTDGANIVPMPEELARPGRTIYWRVDTQPPVAEDTTTHTPPLLVGNTWEYTYVNPYSDDNALPPPPGRCRTYTGPMVDLSDYDLSSPIQVSEITIDATEYDERYTLVESRVCFNVTDVTQGVEKMQLRFKTDEGFLILKANNQGGGNELDQTCFSDGAMEVMPNGADGSPFQGEWLPHGGPLEPMVDHFPGSSSWARILVKDHGEVGRDFPGFLEWTLELCYDGWEGPYQEWLLAEEERIRLKEEEEARPWCVDSLSPTAEPLTALPSRTPSRIPSQLSCEDALLPVAFNTNSISCAQFVSLDACDVEIAASHCPNSCNACPEYGCQDSQAPLSVNGGTIFCANIQNFLTDEEIEEVCNEYEVLAFTCRGTCKICEN